MKRRLAAALLAAGLVSGSAAAAAPAQAYSYTDCRPAYGDYRYGEWCWQDYDWWEESWFGGSNIDRWVWFPPQGTVWYVHI